MRLFLILSLLPVLYPTTAAALAVDGAPPDSIGLFQCIPVQGGLIGSFGGTTPLSGLRQIQCRIWTTLPDRSYLILVSPDSGRAPAALSPAEARAFLEPGSGPAKRLPGTPRARDAAGTWFVVRALRLRKAVADPVGRVECYASAVCDSSLAISGTAWITLYSGDGVRLAGRSAVGEP